MAKVKGKTISKSGKQFDKADMERQSKALAENFSMIGDQLMDVLMVGMKKATILLQGRTKRRDDFPVDTGLLRNSISERVERIDENTVLGEVGTNVEYAPSVEFGTSRQEAQPYLGPTLQESKTDITRIVQKAMKEALQ